MTTPDPTAILPSVNPMAPIPSLDPSAIPPGSVLHDSNGNPFTLGPAAPAAGPVFAPSPTTQPAAAAAPAAATASGFQGAAPWLILLLVGGWVGYREFRPAAGIAPAPAPIAAIDPAAAALGDAYREAVTRAGLAGLQAGANATGAALSADISRAIRDALDANLKAAGAPLAAESTRRFGVVVGGTGIATDPAQLASIRKFFSDVAAGYAKGVK